MDEDDERWQDEDGWDEEMTPSEEIEQALQDCGQTGIPGFCAHAGTEFCSFRCPFRPLAQQP